MYRKTKRKVTKYIIGGLTIALVGSGIGIATYKHFDSKCKIPATHRHLYVDKNNYAIYLENEQEKIKGFQKTPQFEIIYESNKDFETRLMEENLVPIIDNLALIHYIENANAWENVVDYDEKGNPITTRAGFYAYKYDLETDTFIKSPPVALLGSIQDDYPYIKVNELFEILDSREVFADFDGFFSGSEEEVEDYYKGSFGTFEDYENDLRNYDNNQILDPDFWYPEELPEEEKIYKLSVSKTKTRKTNIC